MKSYRNGGLTLEQFLLLSKTAALREYDRYKFQAAMQGVDLDKAKKKSGSNTGSLPPKAAPAMTGREIFPDPSIYNNLSPVEKQAMTNRINGEINRQKLSSADALGKKHG